VVGSGRWLQRILNQRWHEYTGVSQEESHGSGWQVAFHPEDLVKVLDKWQAVGASGEPAEIEIEARLRRFDGEYRWFLIRAVPVRDESGKVVSWYGSSTDIEDRKRAEEKLRQDEREPRRKDISPGADRIGYGFSWSNSAFASFRSAVSKPSVNQQ
jgi:PAS domain S-box-containing protein